MKNTTRRSFIKQSAVAGLGSSLIFSSPALLAYSPNETINLAILGLGGRAYALRKALSNCQHVRITHVCDVDQERQDRYLDSSEKVLGYQPTGEADFRKILDNADVDAIAIATPEHWHAPMAIMGMQAGKHVYVEKPCSHNLQENEWLVEAYRKYNKICQMGNQQRSSVTSNKAIQEIRSGIIGDVYYAKAWYSNTRGSIGMGKKVAVPDTLDWELWQGPAPREDYRDNVHPYNWHWFRTWGTGEIHNNGTHEIDICRWAMGLTFPKRVVSTGGRLHFREDDWEYFDTQVASFEYSDGKTLIWEGRSCNGQPQYGRGRGVILHGTEGTIILDRGGYELFDLSGKRKRFDAEPVGGTSTSTRDLGGFDGLTVDHMQNFLNAIREGEELKAPIDDASISTHLCHLGNIAQDMQTSLDVDPKNGNILKNPEALKHWSRAYEQGWEVKV